MSEWANLGLYEAPEGLPPLAPQRGPATSLSSSKLSPCYRLLRDLKRLACLYGSSKPGNDSPENLPRPYKGFEELYQLLLVAKGTLPALMYAQGGSEVGGGTALAQNIALQAEVARRLDHVKSLASDGKRLNQVSKLEEARTWEGAWLSLNESEA